MMASYLRTSKQGADTIVYAATSPQITRDTRIQNGSFLFDRLAANLTLC